ncbi:MAG: BON domain-containing protein [Gammaproteobacteria bacterium]
MKISALAKLTLILPLIAVYTPSFAQQVDEVNPITSEAMTHKPSARDMKLTSHDDAIIVKSIKSHLHNSKTLSKLKIDVKSTDGNVLLVGNVDSDSQAGSIVEIAQSIVGVKDVDASGIKVKDSSQPYADMVITAKAKGLLLREKVFGKKDVSAVNLSVETKDGVVYLTGAIEKNVQIENAIKIIQGIKGVSKVEYNIKKVETTN